MLTLRMRQIALDEAGSGYEDVAELSSAVVSELARRGIAFTNDVVSDEAGPTRWAAVELDDGTQLQLVHHYAHQDAFLELRARASEVPPAMIMARFLYSLDLMPEVYAVADTWSVAPR